MSRFLSPTLEAVTPYTPGEQPQDQQYIKLDTNESPYLPSPAVVGAVSEAVEMGRCEGCNELWLCMPAPEPGYTERRADGSAPLLAAG